LFDGAEIKLGDRNIKSTERAIGQDKAIAIRRQSQGDSLQNIHAICRIRRRTCDVRREEAGTKSIIGKLAIFQ